MSEKTEEDLDIDHYLELIKNSLSEYETKIELSEDGSLRKKDVLKLNSILELLKGVMEAVKEKEDYNNKQGDETLKDLDVHIGLISTKQSDLQKIKEGVKKGSHEWIILDKILKNCEERKIYAKKNMEENLKVQRAKNEDYRKKVDALMKTVDHILGGKHEVSEHQNKKISILSLQKDINTIKAIARETISLSRNHKNGYERENYIGCLKVIVSQIKIIQSQNDNECSKNLLFCTTLMNNLKLSGNVEEKIDMESKSEKEDVQWFEFDKITNPNNDITVTFCQKILEFFASTSSVFDAQKALLSQLLHIVEDVIQNKETTIEGCIHRIDNL